MRTLIFGADGGGTKTLGLLSDLNGTILAQRTVGASNVNVVGFEAASRHLHELITGCCADAHADLAELRSIVLGLSGAGRDENKRTLLANIAALAGTTLPITIETDARIGLEGAFDGEPGVVIIAGTGSVVIGKMKDGSVTMVGGWGRAFGDQGSGFFFGREALKAHTIFLDNRGGSALIAQLLEKEFGLNSRDKLIAAVYQEQFEMSKVAPLVMHAAGQNDAIALDILHKGAAELAAQAAAVVSRISSSDPIGICYFGGLIDHETVYSRILSEHIAKAIPHATLQHPKHSPAHGALLMARNNVKGAV